MKTIWKFETQFKDGFEISMPYGAEIISIQTDEKTNKPCIWAIVETENRVENRYFELFGTGNHMNEDMGIERKYIGTYQYQKGEFVGHLFERIN